LKSIEGSLPDVERIQDEIGWSKRWLYRPGDPRLGRFGKAICREAVAESVLASLGFLSMGIMFIHNPLIVPSVA
jgi:hypothetical protein